MKNEVLSKNKHTYLGRSLRLATMASMLVITSNQTHAQSLVADWDVTGVNSWGPSPWMPTTYFPHLTYEGLTRGADVGTTGTAPNNAWGGESWTGTAGSDVSFSITADPGYTLTIDSIDISFRRKPTGPAYGMLEYSINGGPYNIGYYLGFVDTSASGWPIPTLDFTDSFYSDLQNIPAGHTLTFRFTALPALGGGSNGPLFLYNSPFGFHGCKGLRIFGKVEPVCALPTLSFSGITDDGVTVNWSTIPGALGYEYAVYSTLDPPTVWTYTSSTSVTLSGLDPATQYYFYIRTICPSGDTAVYTGAGFLTQNATGIFQQANRQLFDVYPNPVDNQLIITLQQAPETQGQLLVTDMAGKIQQSFVITGTTTVIPMAELATGTYLVQYTDEHSNYSSLIVKQ